MKKEINYYSDGKITGKPKQKMTKYLLYDGRAFTDKDSAICYSSCNSLAEAKKEKQEDFPDAIIFKEEMELVRAPNQYEVISSKMIIL